LDRVYSVRYWQTVGRL